MAPVRLRTVLLTVLLGEMLLASWLAVRAGERGLHPPPPPAYAASNPFSVRPIASFNEPWALAVDAGTGAIIVTEKRGAIK